MQAAFKKSTEEEKAPASAAPAKEISMGATVTAVSSELDAIFSCCKNV